MFCKNDEKLILNNINHTYYLSLHETVFKLAAIVCFVIPCFISTRVINKKEKASIQCEIKS